MKKFKLTIITSILFIILLLISLNTNSAKGFIKGLQYLSLITFMAALISELYKDFMNPESNRSSVKIVDESLKGIVKPEMSDSDKEQLIKSLDSVRKKGDKK